MLYTDMNGERKIRVFNFSWIVQKTLFNYFKSTEVTNFSMFKIRQELSTATKLGVQAVKQKILDDLVKMF